MTQPIVIVGAGISGLTLSILLKQLGRKVIVIEKRSPYQTSEAEDPRSFNLTITQRGMKSFRSIGIEEQILSYSVPMEHRVIHHHGKRTLQKYGTQPDDRIFSIKRSDLIQILYEKAKLNKNCEIRFDTEFVEINRENSTIVVQSRIDRSHSTLDCEFVIGADGAYSRVRNFVLSGEIVDFQIHYFDWFYKKFVISEKDGIALQMDPMALHVFPQKGALVVAIPNQDRSFSSIYCTTISNPTDVKSASSHQEMQMKFQRDFPQLFELDEEIRNSLQASKISGLVNVKLSKWRYEGKVVLVGDSAHAVFPFYGQGMNAALQDCRDLISCLARNHSLKDAFAEYETKQKESTHALAALSKAHFYYLQEESASPLLEAQGLINQFLLKKLWQSEYRLVAQTDLPYNEIVSILKRQSRLRKFFGIVLIDYLVAGIILLQRIWGKKIKAA